MDEARLCGSSLPTGPIALPALGRSRPGPKNPTWLWWDSNPRPSDPQSDALTTALRGPVDMRILLSPSKSTPPLPAHRINSPTVNRGKHFTFSVSPSKCTPPPPASPACLQDWLACSQHIWRFYFHQVKPHRTDLPAVNRPEGFTFTK